MHSRTRTLTKHATCLWILVKNTIVFSMFFSVVCILAGGCSLKMQLCDQQVKFLRVFIMFFPPKMLNTISLVTFNIGKHNQTHVLAMLSCGTRAETIEACGQNCFVQCFFKKKCIDLLSKI